MKVAKSYENYSWNPEKIYEKNGRKYVTATCKCDRCINGIYPVRIENNRPVPSPIDGGVCYSCKGTGYISKEIRVYEDREFEQMEKANIKAAEKREAAREAKMKAEYADKRKKWLEENGFNENLTTFIYFPVNSFDVKEELKSAGFRFSSYLLWHVAEVPSGYEESCAEVKLDQVAELGAWGEGFYNPEVRKIVEGILKSHRPVEENTSEWIGEEKERLRNLIATLKSVRGMETKFGWTQLVKFETESGAELNWWTAVEIKAEVGDIVSLDATVKKHDEYNNKKITVITRAKIKAV